MILFENYAGLKEHIESINPRNINIHMVRNYKHRYGSDAERLLLDRYYSWIDQQRESDKINKIKEDKKEYNKKRYQEKIRGVKHGDI